MAMPVKKRPKNRRSRSGGAGTTYRFKIDAYSPATMPMARLAEYMAELATILGEPAAVHFDDLDEGRTVLKYKVDREAVPKVRARVVAVRRGEATGDAERATKALNRLLRDDNAIGLIQEKPRSAIILKFPGRELQEEKFPSVREAGSIDGILTRVEGNDDTIHIGLKVDGRPVSGCYTDVETAKRLGHYFFEPVRLFGHGNWNRDANGVWTLSKFKVESFEALSSAPLSEALADIRRVGGDWGAGSYEELGIIRHGPGERKNGGH